MHISRIPKIALLPLGKYTGNNIVPIGIVLIFAIFQHYIRKRKYAHL